MMKKLLALTLLLLSLNASAQVKVTHIAVKETNMQNWSDVDWMLVDSLSITLNGRWISIMSPGDTVRLRINTQPLEMQRNMWYTDATTYSGGERIHMKFNFDKGYLTQVYLLVLNVPIGNYFAEHVMLDINREPVSISRIGTQVMYIDIVLETDTNNVTENIWKQR